MKNQQLSIVLILILGMVSCQKETEKPDRETGMLHIDVGLFIEEKEAGSQLKSTLQTENFKVEIFRADGTPVLSYPAVTEMPDQIELETGDYYVEAHSDNNLPAAFENPFYFGSSEEFTIGSNSQESVLVTCRLANTMVSVHYSDQTLQTFSDYTTTVSSAEGSLVFVADETRTGFFRTLPLDVLVELYYLKPDGTSGLKTMNGSIPDPLPNRHYEIHVDASLNEGMASFQIVLDESAVEVEVIPLNETTVPPPAGAIAYGELLITEIMYDPSSLSDTEGEWFEIYNASGRTIQLQNLILGRDDTNRHTIAESVELAPGSSLVLARTDQATGIADSYLYGSDITLSNTGAVLSLFNEGTEDAPGALIFSVDYGAAGFPGGSGASIALDPGHLNAADAISGSFWCTSSSAYVTGDLGTPGAVNDSCQ